MKYFSNQFSCLPKQAIINTQKQHDINTSTQRQADVDSSGSGYIPQKKQQGGNLALQSATAPYRSHARAIPTKVSTANLGSGSKKRVAGGYIYQR